MPCYKLEVKANCGAAISGFVAVLLLTVLAKPGVAQEVEGRGHSGTALFSPPIASNSPSLSIIFAVNRYGFYLGKVRSGIALIEVSLTLQKRIGVTPRYVLITVPPSGLLTGTAASQSYTENQFRLAASCLSPGMDWSFLTVPDHAQQQYSGRKITPTIAAALGS